MADTDTHTSATDKDKDEPKPEAADTQPEMAEPQKEGSATPKTDAEADSRADPETDKAVEDIEKHDGDADLKAQDEAAAKPVVMKQHGAARFKEAWQHYWSNPKSKWSTIGGLVIIIALFAVPMTRWSILGVVFRADATVTVLDSKTNQPVSGAQVQLGGAKGETNADGKAVLHAHLGSHQLNAAKKYYAGTSDRVLVGMSANGNRFTATLVAQGRQVQIKLVNKITAKPLAGVKITVAGANAKSDKNGLATLVIPSGATTQEAEVSLAGYNTAKVKIDATKTVANNTFGLVPAGKLYFLSNLSGTIDVVKTNLDGSGRATVLAGTGKEDPNSTSLLASRDWKYLALLAKRDGDTASIYLIDTTNGDKVSTIDEGNANFSLVGWSGDRLVYTVDRSPTVQSWQPGQYALKSFDPTTGHTLLLDQTQASGTSNTQYTAQSLGVPYLIGDQVVYTKGWQADSYYYSSELAGKMPELDSIGADGSGHKTIKSFTVANSNYLNIGTKLYEPDALYLRIWNQNDGQATFYEYENGKVTEAPDMTDDTFGNTPYPTYLLSPSGNQTFWTDFRDGKNTLFTGNDDAGNSKQIASLSDYSPYGWYTDNYLLVSKNSSELYIMPATGGTPQKITDYYKPAVNYQGYGGGYGGL